MKGLAPTRSEGWGTRPSPVMVCWDLRLAIEEQRTTDRVVAAATQQRSDKRGSARETGSRRDTDYEALMAIPLNPVGGFQVGMSLRQRRFKTAG
jgi:hypothetical protein